MLKVSNIAVSLDEKDYAKGYREYIKYKKITSKECKDC